MNIAESAPLTIQEVAALVRVSVRTLESLLAKNQMPTPVRVGRQRRWSQEAIRRWLETGNPGRDGLANRKVGRPRNA